MIYTNMIASDPPYAAIQGIWDFDVHVYVDPGEYNTDSIRVQSFYGSATCNTGPMAVQAYNEIEKPTVHSFGEDPAILEFPVSDLGLTVQNLAAGLAVYSLYSGYDYGTNVTTPLEPLGGVFQSVLTDVDVNVDNFIDTVRVSVYDMGGISLRASE